MDSPPQPSDRLLYFGIDEAGYGPRLGPLCVAYSAFECDGWRAGEPPPDLWELLKAAVCRTPAETRSGRLAVGDSKKLKLTGAAASGSMRRLAHLERGVLAFLALSGVTPATDADLLDTLTGSKSPSLPWYRGPGMSLPFSTSSDHIALLSAHLGRSCQSAGVRFVKAGCHAMDEMEFNRRVRRSGNKALVSFAVVAALLRRLWEREAPRGDLAEGGPRVVVDRQGGRVRYAEPLAQALPDASVRIIGKNKKIKESYEG